MTLASFRVHRKLLTTTKNWLMCFLHIQSETWPIYYSPQRTTNKEGVEAE